MKKTYEKPQLEVFELTEEDVITTSTLVPYPGNWPGSEGNTQNF